MAGGGEPVKYECCRKSGIPSSVILGQVTSKSGTFRFAKYPRRKRRFFLSRGHRSRRPPRISAKIKYRNTASSWPQLCKLTVDTYHRKIRAYFVPVMLQSKMKRVCTATLCSKIKGIRRTGYIYRKRQSANVGKNTRICLVRSGFRVTLHLFDVKTIGKSFVGYAAVFCLVKENLIDAVCVDFRVGWVRFL